MGQRFDLPGFGGMDTKLSEVRQSIQDSKLLTKTSRRQLRTYLQQINHINGEHDAQNAISALEVYKWFVSKEKTLYRQLNFMRQGQSTYIGYFWSPTDEEDKIKDVLQGFPTTDFKRFSNHTIKAPTYIKTNEFTAPFQEIVNTYGIPLYKEVNPAIFACVSFPFLFGVMFGDMGHGSLMFIFGLLLVFGDPWIRNSSMEVLSFIRYLILLMGFFAFYNGLIYNEVFAIPVEFFRSCYSTTPSPVNASDPYSQMTYQRLHEDCVYDIGMDPRWAESDQYLNFCNSMKMKIAVILGVAQMSLGICMKAFNAVHFKRPLDFFFEFIPQIILLNVLFGWMDILIIAKWIYPFQLDWTSYSQYAEVAAAPSVITCMINMFLLHGTPPEEFSPKMISVLNHQTTVGSVFVVIILICVPVMLCVKPCVLNCQHKKHAKAHQHDQLEH